jgi:hypothetical protein
VDGVDCADPKGAQKGHSPSRARLHTAAPPAQEEVAGAGRLARARSPCGPEPASYWDGGERAIRTREGLPLRVISRWVPARPDPTQEHVACSNGENES